MTVANAMQKARRGVRPGSLHDFFRLAFLARVAFRYNGISGLFDRPVMAELMVDDVLTCDGDSYVLLHELAV
jgi:hypothetical protein